jgi:Putative Ig domain
MIRGELHKLGLICLTVFCLASQSGCSEEKHPAAVPFGKSGVEKTMPVAVGSGKTASSNPTVVESSGLAVVINPNPATVADDLHALASGNPRAPEYLWEVNGEPVPEARTNALPSGNFSRGDSVTVTLIEAKRKASASVTIGNSPPRIKSVDFADHRIHCGVDVVVNPEVEDLDGDDVSFRYLWTVNGEEVGGLEENVLPGDQLKKGDRVTFTVIPNDGYADGNPYVCSEFVIPDAAPRFISKHPLEFQGHVYLYEARAEDPDGDDLQYLLEDGPEGMTVEPSTGLLRWDVAAGSAGQHHVKIAARDDEGLQATQDFVLTVTIPGQDD